ncbi:MAG TPA: hypothetical protein RMF84_09115 [Polyangiaceae bacterium LLY-WYZ-14_1]|nr:hypothetical protein [Polyangiaceae bacterium LLY-WYZ-14_1]
MAKDRNPGTGRGSARATALPVLASLLGAMAACSTSGDGERCTPLDDAQTVETETWALELWIPRADETGRALGFDLDGTDARVCGNADFLGLFPGDLDGVDASLNTSAVGSAAQVVDRGFATAREVPLFEVRRSGDPEASRETCAEARMFYALPVDDEPPRDGDGRLRADLTVTDAPDTPSWSALGVYEGDGTWSFVADAPLRFPFLIDEVSFVVTVYDPRLRWVAPSGVEDPDGDDENESSPRVRWLLGGALEANELFRDFNSLLPDGVAGPEEVRLVLRTLVDLAPDDDGFCTRGSVAVAGRLLPVRSRDPGR